MLHYDLPRLHQFYLGSAKGPFVYPEGVVYVSTSRSQEQVLDELRGSFEQTYAEVLSRHLNFIDLSREYFADTVVPAAWASVPSPLLGGGSPSRLADGGPLRALVEGIDADRRTPARRRGLPDRPLGPSRGGVRRHAHPPEGAPPRAKEWSAVVYLILSEGVVPPAMEQAVIDSVDGVLHFSWTTSPSHSHRQRTMLIEKFMPVLAHVPAEYHGRFVIRVGAQNGLVTTQYERI